MSGTATQQRRERFAALHRDGCFVLPNAWDAGSARVLAGLGFPALASTSAGHAWTHGRLDGGMGRDAVLAHLADLVAATDLPVNADFENGYGATPDDVAAHVRLAADTGIAGLSIEDASGDPDAPLYALPEAVERVAAAHEALAGTGVLLVGRAEGFVAGNPDLDDVVTRLRAYAEAGADCLFAPGVTAPEAIRTVVDAVAPKPVNVLVGAATDLTVADLAALGVRRISLGGALARAAWTGLLEAARPLASAGSFAGLAGTVPTSDLAGYFDAP